jgi:hypothetical protein
MNILTVIDRINIFVTLLNHLMMRTNLNLLFFLKKRINYTTGSVAIYLRFTVDGQRAEASTGKTCDPKKWNSKAKRASGTKEDVKSLNAHLDGLQFQILEMHKWMVLNDEHITADNLKNRFIGKVEKVRTLLSVFEDHNQKMKSLVGQEFEKSTLQRYETALMHTRDFMEWKYNISDIPVNKINLAI